MYFYENEYKVYTTTTSNNDLRAHMHAPKMCRGGSNHSTHAHAEKVKELNDVLVIHDDMDLEPGEVKLKIGGGHSGHRGLKDIINKVGDDFVRLRLGIGHPPVKNETNAWVIKKPTPSEKEGLNNAFTKANESLDPGYNT